MDRAGVASGRALDLGAGTGLLSRALADRGLEVVAAEPNPAMRQELVTASPGVEVIAAGAEELDIATDSIALVTAGQAYHWFELPQALPEIHRVLLPGGHFAVLWLRAELSDPLQGRIDALADRLMVRTRYPGARPGEPLRWGD